MAKNEVVVKPQAEIAKVMFDDDTGPTGLEGVTSRDIAIPFVEIAQANSEAVTGSNPIPGITVGDFYNSATREVYGKEITVVPCRYKMVWNEWTPRTPKARFVMQHLDDSILSQTTRNEKNKDALKNGNVIEPTATYFCVVVQPGGSFSRVVMGFSGTKVKKSKAWLSQITSLRVADSNGVKKNPKMFTHMYTITTVPESNDKGRWFGPSIGAPRIITDADLFAVAKQFNKEVMDGDVTASQEVDNVTPVDDTIL